MYSDYALISNGTVMEIIFGNFYNCDQIAKRKYGTDAYAVEVWSHYYPPTAQYPVIVGDTYENSKFYRVGTEVTQQQSESSRIAEQSAAIDDIIVAITPTEAN